MNMLISKEIFTNDHGVLMQRETFDNGTIIESPVDIVKDLEPVTPQPIDQALMNKVDPTSDSQVSIGELDTACQE